MEDSESTNKTYRCPATVQFSSKNQDENRTRENFHITAPMCLGNALSEDVFAPTELTGTPRRRGILKRSNSSHVEDRATAKKKKFARFSEENLETIIEIPNSRENPEIRPMSVVEYKLRCKAYRRIMRARKEAKKRMEEAKRNITISGEGSDEVIEIN